MRTPVSSAFLRTPLLKKDFVDPDRNPEFKTHFYNQTHLNSVMRSFAKITEFAKYKRKGHSNVES